MAGLKDEVLLKRAEHAGRNLFVLAALATFVAVIFGGAVVLGGGEAPVAVIACAAALLATGYWTLAHAARRGNPASVTIAIVALLAMLILALVLRIIAGAAGVETNDAYLGLGMLVLALICYSLWRSRSVLLQLKDRNLWEQVFGKAGPSRKACIVGGIFLAAGYLGMIGARAYSQVELRRDRREASLLLDVTQNEESDCMAAFQDLAAGPTTERLDAALVAIERLERRVAEVKARITNDKLRTIADTYGLAVQNWKNGIVFLRQEEPDLERAQRALVLGDQFRAEAGESFDASFGPAAAK